MLTEIWRTSLLVVRAVEPLTGDHGHQIGGVDTQGPHQSCLEIEGGQESDIGVTVLEGQGRSQGHVQERGRCPIDQSTAVIDVLGQDLDIRGQGHGQDIDQDPKRDIQDHDLKRNISGQDLKIDILNPNNLQRMVLHLDIVMRRRVKWCGLKRQQ